MRTWVAIFFGCVTSAASVLSAAETDPFADCDRRLVEGEEIQACGSCYYDVAKQGLQDEAIQLLEGLIPEHPGQTWLLFNLGRIRLDWVGGAEEPLRRAADAYKVDRAWRCAVISLENLALAQRADDGLNEAVTTLAEARDVAEILGDRELLIRVTVTEAQFDLERGGDLEEIVARLEPFYSELGLPGCSGTYTPCRNLLFTLSTALYELGRESSQDRLRELISLIVEQEENDFYNEAAARFNLASYVAAAGAGPYDWKQAVAEFRRALDVAIQGENRGVEIDSHVQLGRLLPGTEGAEHRRAAAELAEREGGVGTLDYVLAVAAPDVVASDPEEAVRRIEAYTRRLVASGNERWIVYGWFDRLEVYWQALPPEEALDEALLTLDFIDVLRQGQGFRRGRAEFFAVWTEIFHWLSGRLLERAVDTRSSEDLRRAFEVAERMRARVLQDALLENEAAPSAVPAQVAADRVKILEELRATRLNLFQRDLPEAERAALQGELGDSINKLDRLRARSAGVPPIRPPIVPLDEISGRLPADTALLSFQFAPWKSLFGGFAGGSWLLVTTTESTKAYKLDGADFLQPKLETFLRHFEPQDEDAVRVPDSQLAAPAAALHDLLLEPALSELPRRIERLVLVPDGTLHLVPFGLLAPEGGATLVERYELSIVPSAAIWFQISQAVPGLAERPALVLADPALPAGPGDGSATPGTRAKVLGRLPFAQLEAKDIVRSLGPEVRVLAAEDATESAFKKEDLADFAVVHFGAHAEADGKDLESSMIYLMPGEVGEDGRLGPTEIRELSFGGIVVLAVCEGADGRPLRGEGVMSLARPFLEAGARVVVTTLWQIGDKASRELFARFYEELAEGRGVAAALRSAQIGLIEEGALFEEWAGVVVLGDGSFTLPYRVDPSASGRWKPAPWFVVLLILIAIAAIVAGVNRFRNR